MPATPFLRNASVKKDADGDYWLFIEAGDLKAMFCLSHNTGNEDSIERRALAAWLAEQDSMS